MGYFEVEKDFIKEFNKVKKNKELSASQKLIYQHLALSSLESNGYIATSYRQIAKDCGLSLRTVTKGIETLVEKELIEIPPQVVAGKQKNTNLYCIPAISPYYMQIIEEEARERVEKRIEAGDSLDEIIGDLIKDLTRGIF